MIKKTLCSILFFGYVFTINAQTNEVNEPIKNFEFLWQTFNDHYANFELKKVDWKEIYKKYRPSITQKTTNQQLFETSCTMLQELNDGHVTIEPNFEENDIECDPPYTFSLEDTFVTRENFLVFEKVMDQTLLANGFSSANRIFVSEASHFQYRVSDSAGYLRIDEMPDPSFGKLKRALNKSLNAFQNKKAVIIDLRLNGGGWDPNAYAIANRFVTQKHIGHYQKTRRKGTDEFKKLKTWKLKPKGKIQFTGQIIILTSDFTASAAEVFILALTQFPNVTLIGDTTEGIFSDRYEFEMPNDWDVSLSNMQFFSSKMVNYEGVGFEPAIKVKNSRADLETGKDVVIEKTMEFIQSKL